ncbi:MAG: YgjV family protein [Bacteroidetes bacterium]|nr:YgjV family protein [Bacteroidota bacterium]
MLHSIAPWFGYIASLSLIIALLVNSDLKFRWFNGSGNVLFITYALIINAYPVLLTNVILLCINSYYLVKIYTKNELFDLIEFNGKETLAVKFLEHHKSGISDYFPEFNPENIQGKLNFVVLRDLVIANIFSAKVNSNGDAEILINFTVPKYRDFKIGKFIFEKEKDYLISKGIKRIVYKKVANKHHQKFLKIMGFKPDPAAGAAMVKTLS